MSLKLDGGVGLARLGMRGVCVLGFMASICVAQAPQVGPGSSFKDLGFTGDGQFGAVQLFGAKSYALEGNQALEMVFQPPNANPFYYTAATDPYEPPVNPDMIVIREVAKLENRVDGLGTSSGKLELDLMDFFYSTLYHHLKTGLTGSPRQSFDWFKPNAAAILASEAPSLENKLSQLGQTKSYWEVGNEPNLFPSIEPAEYAEIFTEYYRFIKAKSPTAKVGVSIHSNDLILPDAE